MRVLTTLLLLLLVHSSFSQKVRVLEMNDQYEKFRDSRNFDYVHEDCDPSLLTWVADIRVEFDTVIPGMIGESYQRLKERANKFGANAFKVSESDIFSIGEKHIDISVYWINMEDRSQNLVLHQDNSVYLFGFLGYHEEIDGYDVTIQDVSVVMHALTYRRYAYPPKTNVDLQLGSKVRGTKVSFRMEEKMYPKFYYFNMLSGSFKNAWIDEYPLSYGLFLTKLLRKE